MERLYTKTSDTFKMAPDAEIAIEVDPRVTTFEQVRLLKDMGFNRISLGVQDFEPKVQEAVDRIQPLKMTEGFLDYARETGFDSINLDLIYGLPHQTAESFKETVTQIIRLAPERIALYNYAHVPWKAAHQKSIAEETLPDTETKFRIFQDAIERMTAAGYVYIGMDHFAKPTDELAVALKEGRLSRNFMGYTVLDAETELYGFGVSAISGFHRQYAQNVKKLSEYYERLDQDILPTMLGHTLSDDDVIRRAVILAILCQGGLQYADFKTRFDIDAQDYFAEALAAIRPMADDQLLTFSDTGFQLTTLGRVFSRNIAMPFDAYLKAQQASAKPTFSKTL